jgi:uncharacterized phage protein (TIGR01671 family)
MNREIKFRYYEDGEFYYWAPSEFNTLIDWDASQDATDAANGDLAIKAFEKTPDSEQFLGYYDKNGEEIYENDIVKTIYGGIGRVVFETQFYSHRIECTDHKSYPIVALRYNETTKESKPVFVIDEVIGNIHQHTHLLK